ncbi:hypothetical protein SAMN05216548_103111 [Faunimonas pinastri]|uniref:Uncharacterized protein n=1 Tax=Faunimonas pinastri TaxID=1855383 RepID=A0A1H9E9K9_9HYPH|nr:hypothetical protein [Faunimonas pinastri]SEQ22406.1 hypothetical protein SAMN05216548_103111 [Faunimonas pinastri]
MKCAAVLVALLCASPALADEPRGCDKFKWPIVADQQANLNASRPLPSGREGVAPAGSMIVSLTSLGEAGLPKQPERSPRDPQAKAGFIRFAAPPQPGPIQLTLADAAWLDVVQDGNYVEPSAFSGALDCPGARKSIRFDLKPAPFTLQFSGSPVDRLRLTLHPVE